MAVVIEFAWENSMIRDIRDIYIRNIIKNNLLIAEKKRYQSKLNEINNIFKNCVQESTPILQRLSKKVSVFRCTQYLRQKDDVKSLKTVYAKFNKQLKYLGFNTQDEIISKYIDSETDDYHVNELKLINKKYKRSHKRFVRFLSNIKDVINSYDRSFNDMEPNQ